MRLFTKKGLATPALLAFSLFYSVHFFSKVFSFFSFIFMTQSQITCSSPKTHPRCTWILNHKDNFPNYLFMFPFLQLPVSFFFFFNWSIVDLHCCVCFCYIAERISYTYIHSFRIFPIQLITELLINYSLFIYFWLCWIFIAVQAFLWLQQMGATLQLWCSHFSLRWLLLLLSRGSRAQAQ